MPQTGIFAKFRLKFLDRILMLIFKRSTHFSWSSFRILPVIRPHISSQLHSRTAPGNNLKTSTVISQETVEEIYAEFASRNPSEDQRRFLFFLAYLRNPEFASQFSAIRILSQFSILSFLRLCCSFAL